MGNDDLFIHHTSNWKYTVTMTYKMNQGLEYKPTTIFVHKNAIN